MSGFNNTNDTLGVISHDPNATPQSARGFNSVVDAARDSINSSANTVNDLLANYDPSDPGSLLRAQQALANYNLSITVTSSVIKSLEDTTKAVAQHL